MNHCFSDLSNFLLTYFIIASKEVEEIEIETKWFENYLNSICVFWMMEEDLK